MKQALGMLFFDIRRSWRTDKKMSYGAHLLGLLFTGAILWFPLFIGALITSPYLEMIRQNALHVLLFLLFGFAFYGWWWYVLIFRVLARHNDHMERKKHVWDDISRLCSRQLEAQGLQKDSHPDLYKKVYSLELFANEYKKVFVHRSPALWTFLTFMTLGIISYVVAFFVMQDLQKMQQFEDEYLQVLSEVFQETGLLDYPIILEKQIPYREYGIFFALAIVSMGLFWFYWWYILLKDGNSFFEMSERWEMEIFYSLMCLNAK